MGWFRNFVGDRLGYARCPLTGGSLYGGFVSINITSGGRGSLFGPAVGDIPTDELWPKEFIIMRYLVVVLSQRKRV
jgi:hypothetical protein